MNITIKKELDKLNIQYDENTTNIKIPKKVGIKLNEDCCYILHLSSYLLNLLPNDALVVNWNQGIKPTCDYYKADINKIMGNMIKITGIGYDYINKQDINSTFHGWLPLEHVEVIEKL